MSIRGRRGGDGPRSPRRRRLLVARARRLAAALAVGVAAWITVGLFRPPAPAAGMPFLAAVRDLPAGHVLGDGDVRLAHRTADDLPRSVVGDPAAVLGRALAVPLEAGEPITAARLRGPGLLAAAAPESVAVSVPLADAALLVALHPGDRVRVLATGTGTELADGTVLLAEAPTDSALGIGQTARLILAVPGPRAAALAAASGPGGATGGLGGGFVVALLPSP